MTTTAPLPRTPESYRPTLHLLDRKHCLKERCIDSDVIRTCIETGDITPSGDNFKFSAVVKGVRYTLVVSPDTLEIITAYPEEIVDYDTAWIERGGSELEQLRRCISD